MSTRQVITTKQAKHQVNILGFPLILYILLNLLLWNGTGIIYRFFPDSLLGIDPGILCMAAGCVLLLLITFGCFSVSALRLHLPISDYLQPAGMDMLHRIALVCIGIAITVLTTYTGSFLNFLLHPAGSEFAFIGHFTTKANIIRNILYLLLYVLLKPVCDEYIFRGIIQRQLGHYSRFFRCPCLFPAVCDRPADAARRNSRILSGMVSVPADAALSFHPAGCNNSCPGFRVSLDRRDRSP